VSVSATPQTSPVGVPCCRGFCRTRGRVKGRENRPFPFVRRRRPISRSLPWARDTVRACMTRLLSFIRTKPRGFFAACTLAGFGIWALPFLHEPNGNMAVAPALITFVSAGLVVGMLAPERPWRWAVAIVIAGPLSGLATTIFEPSVGVFGSVGMLLLTLPLWLFIATPIAAGAYVGRFLFGYRRDALDQEPARMFRAQLTEFLLSTMLCGLAFIILPSLLMVALAAVTLICASLFTGGYQVSPWRSAALSVAGALAAFATSDLYDQVRGGPNHHMLPFEVWFVLVVTVPAAITGAWFAYLIRPRPFRLT
jgi:hypothetical protein